MCYVHEMEGNRKTELDAQSRSNKSQEKIVLSRKPIKTGKMIRCDLCKLKPYEHTYIQSNTI